MQKQPMTDEQCAVVREVLEKVLMALRECDGRYDSGDRIVVNPYRPQCSGRDERVRTSADVSIILNLSPKDVSRIRGALKSL